MTLVDPVGYAAGGSAEVFEVVTIASGTGIPEGK